MNIKLIVITILVILVVAIGTWFVMFSGLIGDNGGQSQNTPSDTIANITVELNNVPDDATANKELNNLNEAVTGF